MLRDDAITVNGQPLQALALVADDFYEWQPLGIACVPQPNVVGARLIINDLDLGPPTTTLGDPTWRWRWNPEHAIGRYEARLELSIGDGSRQNETFELRILPRKLDIARYEALITAVQRDAYSIVYALSGGREGAALRLNSLHGSLVEEYWTLVDAQVIEALAIVKQIAARPHQTLAPRSTEVSLSEAERIDSAALAEIARGPLDDLEDDVLPALQTALRQADRTQGGPLPPTLPAHRSAASTDVIEHRVLKQVVAVLRWRVGYVREMLRRELLRRQRNAPLIEGGAPAAVLHTMLERATLAQRGLRAALTSPLLESVGPLHGFAGPTHLMRREPRYRRLYELYRRLRATPFIAFDCPTLWLPIRELPLLYEQWCALQVVKAVLPLGELIAQELVTREDADGAPEARWTVRLNQQSPLVVVRRADGTLLSLIYQRRYQPQPPSSSTLGALDPFVRIPDLALEINRPGAIPRVLIFDAKYRALPDGRVPQDALDDAYAYRGAIGVAGARATLGAFLLFPGRVPLSTADHVGTLPLTPERTEDLDVLIRRFAAGD